LRQLDAEVGELTLDDLGPPAIRARVRGARMQDAADAIGPVAERRLRTLLREPSDADDELRLERAHDAAERVVARGEERLLLGSRKLVRRAIPPALLDE